jgi:hypothetical protein
VAGQDFGRFASRQSANQQLERRLVSAYFTGASNLKYAGKEQGQLFQVKKLKEEFTFIRAFGKSEH